MLKLNLGCGRVSPSYFTDYVNVDLIKHPGVQVQSDVSVLPYQNEEVDEIYASHILEHFGHYQVSVVLKEWYRVLKYGGLIRIAVPNVIQAFKLAEEYCHKNGYDGEYLARVLHGGQKGENLKESVSNSHRTAFDAKVLQKRCEEVGFITEECYYGNCDDMKARHPSTWIKTDDTGLNVFYVGKK